VNICELWQYARWKTKKNIFVRYLSVAYTSSFSYNVTFSLTDKKKLRFKTSVFWGPQNILAYTTIYRLIFYHRLLSDDSAAVMEEYSYTSTHPLGHTRPVTGSLYLSFLLSSILRSNWRNCGKLWKRHSIQPWKELIQFSFESNPVFWDSQVTSNSLSFVFLGWHFAWLHIT